MKKFNLLILVIFLFNLSNAQQNAGKGLQFNDVAYSKIPMKAPLVRSLYGSGLPSDASIKKWAPYPKSQGSYGTCTGWATTYAARTIIEAQKNNWTDKTIITNNAFSPGFVYKLSQLEGDVNCSTGTYINRAIETIQNYGTPKYSDFSENCPDFISEEIMAKAVNFKVKDYAKIFGLNDGENFKIEATKKSLSENKPVVIGMIVPPSFNNPTGCWTPTEQPDVSYGGHAMCVVGYDDNMYGGAFEIQNSWGDWWGNKGYIWVKYETYTTFTKYAYEIIDDFKVNPAGEIELSGSIKFLLTNASEMQAELEGNVYKMKNAYKSGTKFRFYISNNEPAFVYAFGSDLTNKTYQIFPHNPAISPALNYTQNDLALPDEDHWIEMDNNIGTDFFCVLYSNDLLDIDNIRSQIENETGTFQEKVEKTLGTDLVNFDAVEYLSGEQIGFKTKSKGKSVVALIVEIEHVK
jgi:hypothetical protein